MKIAIQGYAGSFHSLAAKQLYGKEIDLLYCKTFKQVFEALEKNQADCAVIAIENSLYGSINATYDLLQKHNFWISGEVYETVGLHLLGVDGASLSTITNIYSQAPALGESEAFIEKFLPQAELHEHADTALAAQEVATWNIPTNAAIAGAAAAKEYGLTILASNIETHAHNYTRFIALTKNQPRLTSANKTTITFQTEDIPAALYNALGVFAAQNVNLTKLESRPIIGKVWEYMYYVDFNAGVRSPQGKAILQHLPKFATNIKVLGSYTAGSNKTA